MLYMSEIKEMIRTYKIQVKKKNGKKFRMQVYFWHVGLEFFTPYYQGRTEHSTKVAGQRLRRYSWSS